MSRGATVDSSEINVAAVEGALLSHAAVDRVSVVARRDISGQTRLVGYVVATPGSVGEAAGTSRTAAIRQWVAEWQARWSRLYEASADHAPHFAGWNEPLPQMQEWVGGAIRRIEALRPENLLEIGCGVGLLLERLAPRCKSYRGTDISASAVCKLRAWLQTRADLSHAEISQTDAAELDGIDVRNYDTVVLNSVVQYFPDAKYLFEVLTRVTAQITSRRQIFVGDVWNLHLKPAFHCSVYLPSVSGRLPAGRLRDHLARVLEEDQELYIAPEFWTEIAGHTRAIRHVEVALKRGRAGNQMTLYRYDVVLRTQEKSVSREMQEVCWKPARSSIAAIRSILAQAHPSSLRIVDIPNKRVAHAVAALDLLSSSDQDTSVDNLRLELQKLVPVGQDPEDFWELGDSTGYDVSVSWTRASREGHFDVLFSDLSQAADTAACPNPQPCRREWPGGASDPMRAHLRRQLAATLRDHLQAILPEHMVPSRLMIVEELPATRPTELRL